VATTSITYGYDAFTAGSNRGKGKRTSMSDGSGSTVWTYGDARGRLTRESKTITGGGTYVTQWTYDSADQVLSLTYPDNEVVSYTYLPQRLVNSVVGSATYVQASFYDGAMRLSERRLGADQVRIKPVYHGWETQGGRLAQLRAGTPANYLSNPPGLQWLTYSYDAAGNVLSIVDNKADGGTQTQTFMYDALDRLTRATADGGTGGIYDESYSYQANGRMAGGPLGASYNYTDGHHLHAVTSVGSNSFSYDLNGNMTGRSVGGQSYTLSYNAENHLVSVGGAATASFVYDGDAGAPWVRVKGTVGGVTSYYVGKHGCKQEVSG
jgi:YD repeat-containing protein